MNINIDPGVRKDSAINVDVFCHSPAGTGAGQVDALWFPIDGSAEEITIYRTFERLGSKLHRFMIDLHKALSKDGILKLYAIRHDEFREFIGSGKDALTVGYGPYWAAGDLWVQHYKAKEEIIQIFEDYGFLHIGDTQDVANYPSWGMKFKKASLRIPVEYFSTYLPKETDLNTVDIGPGNYPWKDAKNYIEMPERIYDPRYSKELLPNANVIFGNLEKGIPEIKDKQFDFAWASHIFEHTDNPDAAAEELSRIAKRGVVIVPSAYKDAMTYWEEAEHKWDIFPATVTGGKIRFVKRNQQWLKTLKDQEMQSIFGKLYRAPGYETREERYVKQFFMKNESSYDILVEWEGQFRIEVI